VGKKKSPDTSKKSVKSADPKNIADSSGAIGEPLIEEPPIKFAPEPPRTRSAPLVPPPAGPTIRIRGAREHNLRDVSVELPKGRLICMTGVSGSGKSSLAFDTLFAEGQRRYVESLSSYARQFLGQLPKPDVDKIEGLSPAIAIQQKTAGRNPRSTVGTITEISDYLRVLFARVGKGHCPDCGEAVQAQSRDQILGHIEHRVQADSQVTLLAPVIRGQRGEHQDLFEDLLRQGFTRARVDGTIVELGTELHLDRKLKHDIEVVVDRFALDDRSGHRLGEAVDLALKTSGGSVLVQKDDGESFAFSSQFACGRCGVGFPPPSPQTFSFNSPQGWCKICQGLGHIRQLDIDRLIDTSKSLWDGAVTVLPAWSTHTRKLQNESLGLLAALIGLEDAAEARIFAETPWSELSADLQKMLIDGTGDRPLRYPLVGARKGTPPSKVERTWPGYRFLLEAALEDDENDESGEDGERSGKFVDIECPTCHGGRLNRQALATTVGGWNISRLGNLAIDDSAKFFDIYAGELPPGDSMADVEPMDAPTARVATELVREIRVRIRFLTDVGLGYLTLDRSAPSLSGGEAQRIRLASQVGSGLVGVTYILDEPSIGLHPRDNTRLIKTLERLRDAGNTVVVVEHDEETMRAADWIVDFGPGPGRLGGDLVAQGKVENLAAEPLSETGAFLSGRKRIPMPAERRQPTGKSLKIFGAEHHNLRGLDVEIPLGLLVCITGVSGSGKSSLVNDVLSTALARELNGATKSGGAYRKLEGLKHLDKMIGIDQSPIGRTPRSNPGTYIKLFDQIRNLFAQLPEAKARGYAAGRFSFNVTGGRCESCSGNGSNKLEMDFLADVWVTCPVCLGKRFNSETLKVQYRGHSIADILDMEVSKARELFTAHPKIEAMLSTLEAVGLGYLQIGQPSPTLSGGEAQRIKLAKELVRKGTGKTLYILDEPTTGLHFADVDRLLKVLQSFTELGNTVVVIEHNLDIVKAADWIIDMGPEAGDAGGHVVVSGTPEEVAACDASHTGQALRAVLEVERDRDELATAPARRGRPPKKTASSTSAPISPLFVTDAPSHEIFDSGPIRIRGASLNNLKNVTIDLPRKAFSVCSGPSGSGKSTLAIDTLYAEGQRRYVECLSSYARQFLTPLPKPKVDSITGLSPAICIEQKTTSRSPRSTVGTITEIYDYLRILFARLGQPYCPDCNQPVGVRSVDQIVDAVLSRPAGTKVQILAPVQKREAEDYAEFWQRLSLEGLTRLRVDGQTKRLDEPCTLNDRRQYATELVIDRLTLSPEIRKRLTDSVETALSYGQGRLVLAFVDDSKPEKSWITESLSVHRACPSCNRAFEELTPQHFSFNSPKGWCPTCEGLGVKMGADPALLVPHQDRSIDQGAILGWPKDDPHSTFHAAWHAVAANLNVDSRLPWQDLDALAKRSMLYGREKATAAPVPSTAERPEFRVKFKGILPTLDEAGRVSYVYRGAVNRMIGEVDCPSCLGARVREDAAAVRLNGRTIDQLGRWPIGRLFDFMSKLEFTGEDVKIASDLLREATDRLRFLVEVGLEYLSLSRPAPTLSGGESQRIRLAGQIGTGLTGVLYVLDEPTIGLHPRDNARLLGALKRLRDLGNTLVVVEHDREVLESADHIVDFGPGAGSRGGQVVAEGNPEAVQQESGSLTGQYLAGTLAIPVPQNRRPADGKALVVRNARHLNLKGIDVAFPLGTLTVVTGVSGSGKSTLVEDVLGKALASTKNFSKETPGAHDRIDGIGMIDKMIRVDQSPIGATPASTPATYTGMYDLIRGIFANLPESKRRGLRPGHFSFNVEGGRCPVCEGAGQRRIEMHFLPDVWVTCEGCSGLRFSGEVLAVTFRGRSIGDVLRLTCDEAFALFEGQNRLRKTLKTLIDVGLGYLPLGQSATTLSGGEAQRVKLATELARPDTGRTLYLLDEPTTGLHFDDVRKLLDVMQRLVDLGNTVVVIEHNLDLIKTADWVIDLGPEAGEDGGRIVAEGPPETIVKAADSRTGRFLKPVLDAGPYETRPVYEPSSDELPKRKSSKSRSYEEFDDEEDEDLDLDLGSTAGIEIMLDQMRTFLQKELAKKVPQKTDSEDKKKKNRWMEDDF
jgi:excinuclease ABC subunit A